MRHYTVHFIWKLLYMFRVVPPPIIRSANNCIYSIWYLSHRYCYPRFSVPIQTGSGAHPTSYTMGNGSVPGVKRPGRGVDHPPPSSAEVKQKVELYLCSTSDSSWPVLGRGLPLPLPSVTGINHLNPELNPICYFLALLGAHHFLHISRIRVKLLTFRLLMSYTVYMEHPFLMFLDHTQRRSTVGRTPLDE